MSPNQARIVENKRVSRDLGDLDVSALLRSTPFWNLRGMTLEQSSSRFHHLTSSAETGFGDPQAKAGLSPGWAS
jgi:hypothetical protein